MGDGGSLFVGSLLAGASLASLCSTAEPGSVWSHARSGADSDRAGRRSGRSCRPCAGWPDASRRGAASITAPTGWSRSDSPSAAACSCCMRSRWRRRHRRLAGAVRRGGAARPMAVLVVGIGLGAIYLALRADLPGRATSPRLQRVPFSARLARDAAPLARGAGARSISC